VNRPLVHWLLWTALILVLTVPWDLQDHSHWYKVAWRPLAGTVKPLDLLLNFALYLPFGALAPFRRDRLVVVGLLAAALAGGCELSQVWSHSRFPSMTDFIANTLGALAGRLRRQRAVT
jgi:VanZ family protein